jgi:radical SAM protein with 4Fe4S-binding SPASM domain
MLFPFSYITVDIYGRCNLRCKFCPEGQGLNEQPARQMPFSSFQRWIGPVLPELGQLEFFNWSEPFLHTELFEILNWTAEQNPNLELILSTNGTVIDEEMAERLVSSPVKVLTMTMAGLTKEDYSKYHGVDALEKFIKSLRLIARAKRSLRSSNPKIRLRYLRFYFNFVSSAEVRRWVKKHIGVDSSFINGATVREGFLCGANLSGEEIQKAYGVDSKSPSVLSIPVSPSCQKNFPSPAVRADGAVFPCCSVPYRDEYIMGYLEEATLQEIWNGVPYKKFRETLIKGENTVCRNCFFQFPKSGLKLDRYVIQRMNSRRRMKSMTR